MRHSLASKEKLMPKGRWRRHLLYLLSSACLLTLVVTSWPSEVAHAQVAPVLTLEPDRGPCSVEAPVILARGRNFTPRQEISITSRLGRPGGQLFGDNRATVAADGTFAVQIRLFGCGPTTRDGTELTLLALPYSSRATSADSLAQATFTVSSTTATLPALPNTGAGSKATGLSWLCSLGVGLLLATTLGGACLGRRRASRGRD